MECPRCGASITNETLVCPNCKKVLKIICPKCRAINKTNICRKCGEVLVSKCVKCGKINLTKNEKCAKCGFSTELNVIQSESNTEDFAVLKIEFPNSEIVKTALASTKLYQKFLTAFDNRILKIIFEKDLRRQVYKDKCIIRCNKDYTFTSSANSAIELAIEIAKFVTELNVKLLNKKKVFLKTNITILSRNINSDPDDFNTGFDSNITGQGSTIEEKALQSFQIITNQFFYDLYANKYTLESLDSVLLNGTVTKFYEINIKNQIDIEQIIKRQKEDDVEISSGAPEFIKAAISDQEKLLLDELQKKAKKEKSFLYDVEMIDFEEVNANFVTTQSLDLFEALSEIYTNSTKSIVALKSQKIHKPYALKLLSFINDLNLFEYIIPVTCHKGMKYTAYAFFKELISVIFEYAISDNLHNTNDYSMFNKIDQSNLIKSLIELDQRQFADYEQIKNEYGDVFCSVLEAIPNTLIYIENFENIDESSKFILQRLFDLLEDLNISYLVTYSEEFSLHKDNFHLLSIPYYNEITIIGTPFDKIIADNEQFYENIKSDFYFQRIAKYSYGSTLFLDVALQYLAESGVYKYENNTLRLDSAKTLVIPSTIEELYERRLNLLQERRKILVLLGVLIFIGPRIDIKTVESLDITDCHSMIDTLCEYGYTYYYNDNIYINNYEILQKAISMVLKDEEILEIISNLYNVLFSPSIPNALKAFLNEKKKNHRSALEEWENLANVNLSLGDISAYINCSIKISDILNQNIEELSEEEIENYKLSLYNNVANNIFDYNPIDSVNLSNLVLSYLKKYDKKDMYISFCLKFIQGSISKGDYIYACNITHSLFSAKSDKSIDANADNFDLELLVLSIIYIKILFNLGQFENCLDIGYNILNVLDNNKLSKINYRDITEDKFKTICIESVFYIILSAILIFKDKADNLLNTTVKLLNFIPQTFKILSPLQNYITGEKIKLPTQAPSDNLLSYLIYSILEAFINSNNNFKIFAQKVYKVKSLAKENDIHIFEMFADLLIAYSYINILSFKKAEFIIENVINNSKAKGLNLILVTAWYILGLLKFAQQEYDMAYSVIYNSNVYMEKRNLNYEYFTMLNNAMIYKILSEKGDTEEAKICLTQAKYIIDKYKIKLDLGI